MAGIRCLHPLGNDYHRIEILDNYINNLEMSTIIIMYMNKYMQAHAGIYTTSSDTTHGNHNMHIIQGSKLYIQMK